MSDFFYVQTKAEFNSNLNPSVSAHYLQNSNGEIIINPLTNQGLIAPISIDADSPRAIAARIINQTFQQVTVADGPMAFHAALMSNISDAFKPNGWADLQRSYNGVYAQGGSGFVKDFRLLPKMSG